MPSQPTNWNIIISGAWNLAILTPNGISRRLFDLPAGTPMEVQIAIDEPGSYRVQHEGVIVTPSPRQLDLSVVKNDLVSLEKASQIGKKVLQALPETPVAAAGINIRYSLNPIPNELIDLTKSPIDDVYSDEGYTISETLTQRSLELQPGVINVQVKQMKDGNGVVLMNFHYASSSQTELEKWLSRTAEFIEIAQKLLIAMKITVQQETLQ
jgi:hypothetical protein